MKLGFWKKIKERAVARGTTITVQAPMANVTDAAFRRVIAKYSRMNDMRDGDATAGPDALWNEFVSADGLCSPGREILLNDLRFTETERPIVAQLFTSNPDKMREACKLVAELGFDGIDINMGCPDKTIEKQGAGAAMIKDLAGVAKGTIARSVIRAAHEGAPNLPISVKTRVGYNKDELDTWLPALLSEDLAVLTIHARTRKEMSDVPAKWDYVTRAVKIRDEIQKDIPLAERTLIFGNGDVLDMNDADTKARETGADGVMLGRAIFGNPWLFDRTRAADGARGSVSIPERLNVLVEHTKLFEELLGGIKSFAIMKKHYKAYVSGWDGAKELRMKLMEAKDAEEVASTVDIYLKSCKF